MIPFILRALFGPTSRARKATQAKQRRKQRELELKNDPNYVKPKMSDKIYKASLNAVKRQFVLPTRKRKKTEEEIIKEIDSIIDKKGENKKESVRERHDRLMDYENYRNWYQEKIATDSHVDSEGNMYFVDEEGTILDHDYWLASAHKDYI